MALGQAAGAEGSGGVVIPENRTQFYPFLLELPDNQFEQVVNALQPPKGNVPTYLPPGGSGFPPYSNGWIAPSGRLAEAVSGEKPSITDVQQGKECLRQCFAGKHAMVRDGIPWGDVKEALEEADLAFIEKHFPNYPYSDVLKALEVSVAALEKQDAQAADRYRELAVCRADEAAPETAIITLWGHTGNLSPRKVRQLLSKLVSKGLLQHESETPERRITLHALQHDYLRAIQTEKNGLATLHEQVLSAYRKQCEAGWASGPNDGYFFQHLAFDLFQANRTTELRELLLNFDWLQAKITATEVISLINDYDHLPDDQDLTLVQATLRLSAHVLAREPGQLRERLWGHLQAKSRPAIQALLQQAIPQNVPWLCPQQANLTPPDGPLLRTLEGHSDSVNSVAISPDGQRAVSASGDRTLKVWDLATGRCVATFWGIAHF
jgi:hypothetical protein